MSNVLRMTPAEFLAWKRRQKPAEAPQSPAEAKEYIDSAPLLLRDQIVSAGLPAPFREHVFHESRGWRCDLAWPDRKLAAEVDGGVHRIKGRFLADIEKHNALTLAGWRWIRVTPGQVRNGDALELVKALIGSA